MNTVVLNSIAYYIIQYFDILNCVVLSYLAFKSVIYNTEVLQSQKLNIEQCSMLISASCFVLNSVSIEQNSKE